MRKDNLKSVLCRKNKELNSFSIGSSSFNRTPYNSPNHSSNCLFLRILYKVPKKTRGLRHNLDRSGWYSCKSPLAILTITRRISGTPTQIMIASDFPVFVFAMLANITTIQGLKPPCVLRHF